jgi:LysM repeat protein
MAQHRAPRYVRTKKVIARAPVAAGATVLGLGVLGSTAQASTLSSLPDVPAGTPVAAVGAAPAITSAADIDGYGRHAAPDQNYTVALGDTVARIAAAHAESWQTLYQRNLPVIGGNPNLIFPGQVLLTTGDASAPAAGQSAPVPAPVATATTATATTATATTATATTATATTATATAQITNSAGPVKPVAQNAANAVVSNVPGAAGITIGGTRASAVDPHGHPSGLALDYMVMGDTALGNAIVQYTIDHWDELGVEYVIYQQRILMSPTGAWSAMEDRGSPTANHMDHVHVNYNG